MLAARAAKSLPRCTAQAGPRDKRDFDRRIWQRRKAIREERRSDLIIARFLNTDRPGGGADARKGRGPKGEIASDARVRVRLQAVEEYQRGLSKEVGGRGWG